MSPMRILFVDAYDSFSNNIIGLLECTLDVSVTLVRIDDAYIKINLKPFLSGFDAVVVGPGPGDPRNQEDVGFVNQLWGLQEPSLIPVLGICLGFQSLALAFGGCIERLREPRHGLITEVSHRGTDIFESIGGPFQATQYHSFRVILGHKSLPDPQGASQGTKSTPMLQPLAWDHDDLHNGPVLQAIRHKTKPFWGVQYHPESICTAEAGAKTVRNWWTKSLEWLSSHKRVPDTLGVKLPPPRKSPTIGFLTNDVDHRDEWEHGRVIEILTASQDEPRQLQCISLPLTQLTVVELCEGLNLPGEELVLLDSQQTKGRYGIIGLIIPDQTPKLTFSMSSHRLHISLKGNQNVERNLVHVESIWALIQRILEIYTPQTDPQCLTPFCGGLMGYISYEVGLNTVGVGINPESPTSRASDFNFALVERSIVVDHVEDCIYIQSLLPRDKDWLSKTSTSITSIIKSHELVQDRPSSPLASQDHISPTTNSQKGLCSRPVRSEILEYFKSGEIRRPTESHYRKRVLDCQEALRAGDSYELCLTDQTTVTIPKDDHLDQPWVLYQDLRERNPAPFGAYIRLNGCTILGSSPERFLSWDRDGRLQMRPIKGTVKKSKHMSYDLAKSILDGPKERAENLMIVDLIRHDISGMIGAENCKVAQLMQVEEYETVYQLVSVIEGQLSKGDSARHPSSIPNGDSHVDGSETPASANAPGRHYPVNGSSLPEATNESYPQPQLNGTDNPSPSKQPVAHSAVTGVDVLRAALPPGSMVGAPKKRSCELLREFEDRKPRGIYSGVLGYMDVRGGGDFSVVIRTAFRVDDEVIWKGKGSTGGGVRGNNERVGRNGEEEEETVPYQIWRIGAGGAVTVQSTDLGEFQEMETKLDAILKIFHE